MDHVSALPAFSEAPMSVSVLQDLGEAGRVIEVLGTIPADQVTTEGVDYYFSITDGQTTGRYPGASAQGVSWQPVEVLVRSPIRQIVHAGQPAVRVGQPIALRFAAYCAAERPCSPTVYYRTTPNVPDFSQIVLTEPVWPTVAVRTVSARPTRTGLVLYLFEADIPGTAVDSRGVDYLLKVANGAESMYWPGAPWGLGVGPLGAHHVHTLGPPAIFHAPVVTAKAGDLVQLTWHVLCSTDDVSNCATKAYARHRDTLPVLDPAGFAEVATTSTVVASNGGQFVLQATATIVASAVPGTFEQYFLTTSDGKTNAYSPGTTYQGGVRPTDGVNLGTTTPYTVYIHP